MYIHIFTSFRAGLDSKPHLGGSIPHLFHLIFVFCQLSIEPGDLLVDGF